MALMGPAIYPSRSIASPSECGVPLSQAIGDRCRIANMGEPRTKSDWTIVAGVALLMLPAGLGAYSAAYYAMSKAPVLASGKAVVRAYDAKWKVVLFTPAAKAESLLRRCQVHVVSQATWDALDSSLPVGVEP